MGTTIEQRMLTNLFEQGLFEDQAAAIMELVKVAPENEAMKHRWQDDASDYPPQLLAVAWFSVKRHTLEYIDANCPNAWFRPLFTSEESAS